MEKVKKGGKTIEYYFLLNRNDDPVWGTCASAGFAKPNQWITPMQVGTSGRFTLSVWGQ